MYIKNALLANIGPIKNLNYQFPFDNEGNPKPVVIVGQNGSGKSIFLSYIVNSLISAKQILFTNSEVETGKVYKYRSPSYVTVNETYYFAKLEFEGGLESVEWQLLIAHDEFENKYNPNPHPAEWTHLPKDENSVFWSNFREKKATLRSIWDNNCILYFPANRFEEPGWLNYDNLISRAQFLAVKHVQGFSNRELIQYSPLSQNKDWLLDILLDRYIYDGKYSSYPVNNIAGSQYPQLFWGFNGESTNLYKEINAILNFILRPEVPVRFGIGNRKNRIVSVMRDEKTWILNIFQLSTGEALILNLFLSILRDFDLSEAPISGLDTIRGIVLIDEIDLHLHSDMQINVLPLLIKQFPKVQFIITSHSPLFLLGMQKVFTEDGFSIVSMPEGNEIGTERFIEFQKAYDEFKKSTAFQNDITNVIKSFQKDVVFVEGDYDIRYIRKAADLLRKQELLECIEIYNADGFGNLDNTWGCLDKIWKQFSDRLLPSILSKKVLLLYDCDTKKDNADKGKVSKRVVPIINMNPITKGVENLFPPELINNVRTQKPYFFDVTSEIKKTVRGNQVVIPEVIEVNKDEKGNLCSWLCENGTREDFACFEALFQIIEEFLQR